MTLHTSTNKGKRILIILKDGRKIIDKFKMTLHTSTNKGKRILIILKDGRKIIDKFKDKKSGYVITEEYGKIPTNQIKAMTICKQGGREPLEKL